jgi:hypothetical protein
MDSNPHQLWWWLSRVLAIFGGIATGLALVAALLLLTGSVVFR